MSTTTTTTTTTSTTRDRGNRYGPMEWAQLGRVAARSGEWAQHFSNASCKYCIQRAITRRKPLGTLADG